MHTQPSTNGSSTASETPLPKHDIIPEKDNIAKAKEEMNQLRLLFEKGEAAQKELEEMKASRPHPVEANLRRLGEIQGGLLIALVTIYAVGYIVWAFNASQNNLGALPAIQSQYFVAGIVPVFLLLGVCLLAKFAAFCFEVVVKSIIDVGNPTHIVHWKGILLTVLGVILAIPTLYFYIKSKVTSLEYIATLMILPFVVIAVTTWPAMSFIR